MSDKKFTKIVMENIDLEVHYNVEMYVEVDIFSFEYGSASDCIEVDIEEQGELHNLDIFRAEGKIKTIEDLKRFVVRWLIKNIVLTGEIL